MKITITVDDDDLRRVLVLAEVGCPRAREIAEAGIPFSERATIHRAALDRITDEYAVATLAL